MRWLALIALVSCVDVPKGLGVECSRTSQCDTPLVCRLQACRTECRDERDCPRGSVCLVDERGLGACRLVEEASCGSDSECPAPTTCMDGECLNSCSDECDSCLLDEDCESGERCIGGMCRAECASDRDCRFGGVCASGRCVPTDGGTLDAADAELDASAVDSGIELLPGVGSVAAGRRFSCATSDERVMCWGDFEWELMPTELTFRPTFMAAMGMRVVAPPMGYHFCVISSGGALSCAGVNVNGVLGDGSMTTRETPVAVIGLDMGVEDVAVGNRHTCAIASGDVFCWGNVSRGMLGDGRDELSVASEPVDIGLSGAIDVAVGADSSCAVMSDGRLLCWGDNGSGRAALGTMPFVTTPTDTGIGFNARRVSMGAYQGCALADDASVHCWGFDVSSTPTQVMGVEALDVSVGFGFTCVLTTAREVQCWGDNFNGQLGNGTTSFTPTAPPGTSVGLSDVDEIDAGEAHACARRGSELWCWGFNMYAQLGAGHRGTTDTPVPVLAP